MVLRNFHEQGLSNHDCGIGFRFWEAAAFFGNCCVKTLAKMKKKLENTKKKKSSSERERS